MTDEQPFWNAIAAAPGDARAEALRWADANRRRPMVYDEFGDRPLRWAWRLPSTRELAGQFWTTGTAFHAVVGPQRTFLRLGTQDVRGHDYLGDPSFVSCWYSTVGTAWRDWCESWAACRAKGLDPVRAYQEVGRTKRTGSRWADVSRVAIELRICECPGWDELDGKAKWKWLTSAYPFGERRYTPYRVWCVCCRTAAYGDAGMRPGSTTKWTPGVCGWCGGAGCVACAARRINAEVAPCP